MKPFSRALLAWIFIRYLFRPVLSAGQINSYVAGLNRVAGERHNIACPLLLIGVLKFFERAVAAAINLFGFKFDVVW